MDEQLRQEWQKLEAERLEEKGKKKRDDKKKRKLEDKILEQERLEKKLKISSTQEIKRRAKVITP